MRISLIAGFMAALIGAQSVPVRKDIPAIAKAASGAVVSIIMSDKDGRPIAQGSGFFVSRDGRIVTNYHVVKDGSSAVVKLPDGAFFVVDGVLAFDKVRDIAVIKAHGESFRTVTLGDSDRIQVGAEVVAIGNPLSLESTVSNGIVSAIRTVKEEGGNLLQITAPISPGSSGGPLFNMAGEVVGITTSALKGGENLNFAIPINDAKHLLLAKSETQDLPNGDTARKLELKGDTLGEEMQDFQKRWHDNDCVDGTLKETGEVIGKRCTVKTTFLNKPATLVADFFQLGEEGQPGFISQLLHLDYYIKVTTDGSGLERSEVDSYIAAVTSALTNKYGKPFVSGNSAGAAWRTDNGKSKTVLFVIRNPDFSGEVHIGLRTPESPDI